MVQALTSLKSEGGVLEGGEHKDTYDHNLLKKVKKKAQKKEAKKKAKLMKDTKKWLSVQKMIATKKKKKADQAAAEAAEAAAAAAAPSASASG